MAPLLVAHLAVTAAYVGFQATIRVVAYPLFAELDPAGFLTYHRAYTRRVTYLVGPLFAGLLVTTTGVTLDGAVSPWERITSPALLIVLLAVTAFGAVPRHDALARGFDRAQHRGLLRADSARLLVASAQVALALELLLT